jgi:integrase
MVPRGEERRKSLQPGLTLIYRRPIAGALGTWTAKIRKPDGAHYVERRLGLADDAGVANGETILTWGQAQERATAEATNYRRSVGLEGEPLTVRAACKYYLSVYSGKDPATQRRIIEAHILPDMGDRLVSELKTAEIKSWYIGLARKPARVRTSRLATKPNLKAPPESEEQRRARRATANRLFTVLRAVLSRCFKDGLVPDDREWRRVERFEGVDQARDRFPTEQELIRLQNAASPPFRRLIRAALFTGCRLGELAGLRVGDVNVDKGQVYVTSGQAKSKKSRYIELSGDGISFFRELVVDKSPDALVLTRADGLPWRKNLHQRELARANAAARIAPPLTFHHLRHAYASHLLEAGARIEYVSELLGHASIAVTRKHYAHISRQSLKDAAAKLPSFGYTPEVKIRVLRPQGARRKRA